MTVIVRRLGSPSVDSTAATRPFASLTEFGTDKLPDVAWKLTVTLAITLLLASRTMAVRLASAEPSAGISVAEETSDMLATTCGVPVAGPPGLTIELSLLPPHPPSAAATITRKRLFSLNIILVLSNLGLAAGRLPFRVPRFS